MPPFEECLPSLDHLGSVGLLTIILGSIPLDRFDFLKETLSPPLLVPPLPRHFLYGEPPPPLQAQCVYSAAGVCSAVAAVLVVAEGGMGADTCLPLDGMCSSHFFVLTHYCLFKRFAPLTMETLVVG